MTTKEWTYLLIQSLGCIAYGAILAGAFLVTLMWELSNVG